MHTYIIYMLIYIIVGGRGEGEGGGLKKGGHVEIFKKIIFSFDEESFGKFLCKSNIPTLIN